MARKQRDDDGYVSLEGEFTRADIEALASRGAIEKLSFTQRATLLTEPVARGLRALASVGNFWLWCTTTRAALRHAFALPGLHELNVLSVEGAGHMHGAADAHTLRALRANFGLSEADLFEIARLPALAELGAQTSQLTPHALDALLAMPALTSLDIEDTPFGDAMARRVAQSTTLQALDCGNTKLTGKGLAALCGMRQLRALDLWATRVRDDDLDMLAALPQLEYVSIGHPVERKAPRADVVVAKLAQIPSLRRVWLDGVAVDASTQALLTQRYEYVRIT